MASDILVLAYEISGPKCRPESYMGLCSGPKPGPELEREPNIAPVPGFSNSGRSGIQVFGDLFKILILLLDNNKIVTLHLSQEQKCCELNKALIFKKTIMHKTEPV